MSKVIWKFPIPVINRFKLDMPAGAKVLHVATQNDEPCIWALVDPARAVEARRFRLVGTGHEVTNPGEYVGTFMMRDGALVFHLFAGEVE